MGHAHQGRRIVKVEVVEESEVDEAEHGGVELDEDRHQLHVHALRLVVGEAVRHDPRDDLSHDLGLIVVAFDRDKDFA